MFFLYIGYRIHLFVHRQRVEVHFLAPGNQLFGMIVSIGQSPTSHWQYCRASLEKLTGHRVYRPSWMPQYWQPAREWCHPESELPRSFLLSIWRSSKSVWGLCDSCWSSSPGSILGDPTWSVGWLHPLLGSLVGIERKICHQTRPRMSRYCSQNYHL